MSGPAPHRSAQSAHSDSVPSFIARLPKAELHLHLEGCLTPALLIQLARNHDENLNPEEVSRRYQTRTFAEFLELFKWATSYLRRPSDYAQLAAGALRELQNQDCLYAEITLSVGVMLLRKQDVEANFAAIVESAQKHSARVNWIFDAVRQFGPEKALDVARLAAQMKSAGVVAFGLGGDEESLPTSDFRQAFEYAASAGLHRLAHAGEMGGPQNVRDAIEILGAERIGHGIAAIRDEKLMDLLIAHQIPLEICPASNLRTAALAKLLGVKQARIEGHPLPQFLARGVPVTLSTDDPAMFHITLNEAYASAASHFALAQNQIISLAESSFRHAFLPPAEKQSMLDAFRNEAKNLNLL